jgi:hypothetical protein
MDREDRKDYVSHIMLTKYEEARSQADFTAASIAFEAGVSTVWFYALVGKQFKKLRAQLPGPIVADETLISKLRKEIAELQEQIKKLKQKYELNIKDRLAEAIRHIELLDKENRMLRETVRVLEKRLNDEKLIIFPLTTDSTTVPSNDQI